MVSDDNFRAALKTHFSSSSTLETSLLYKCTITYLAIYLQLYEHGLYGRVSSTVQHVTVCW